MTADAFASQGPLAGVRVLEFGSFIAAPLASRIFADFGAEVIKVETPNHGDELRTWGKTMPTTDGDELATWWFSQARNKRLITLDLRQAEGQRLALELVKSCAVVIENFRPGRMEGWNLGWSALEQANPALVFVRISGFGQTGPYSRRAGYGNVCESMGGLRYITGFADSPPVRVGVSLGDGLTAMQSVIGALLALRVAEQTGVGQVVDVAINESVFAMTEAMVTEYIHLDYVRERTGNQLLRAAPSNVYKTRDGAWMAISGNSDGVFRRLMDAMQQSELATDPRFRDNQQRVIHVDLLDAMIGEWAAGHTRAEVQTLLDAAGVPAGPVYSIADIASDEQFLARDMIVRVDDPRVTGGTVAMSGIVPRLERTPGRIRFTGQALGADNRLIYHDLLGLSDEEMAHLHEGGVI